MTPTASPDAAPARRTPSWTSVIVTLLASVVLGVGVAGAAAWFGRGSIEHLATVAIGALWVGLPVAASALFCGLLAFKRRARSGHGLLAWIALVGAAATILLAGLGASYVPGRILNKWDVLQAKRYCQDLVRDLERHRAAHGTYPMHLQELGIEVPKPPRLIGERFYLFDGEHYGFEFYDPAGIFRGYHYDSDSRRWQSLD